MSGHPRRMQTICRLIRLAPADVANLVADPTLLSSQVQSATVYSDVYRYWHAIEYLLSAHGPGSAAGRWLAMGAPVSRATEALPSSRVLTASQVREIDAALRSIEPEGLAPFYDAAAFDAARVYPGKWRAWEEEFDPLGQVLEHYWFLKEFLQQCAQAEAGALFYFDLLAEGTV